jgi:hypothetical protein
MGATQVCGHSSVFVPCVVDWQDTRSCVRTCAYGWREILMPPPDQTDSSRSWRMAHYPRKQSLSYSHVPASSKQLFLKRIAHQKSGCISHLVPPVCVPVYRTVTCLTSLPRSSMRPVKSVSQCRTGNGNGNRYIYCQYLARADLTSDGTETELPTILCTFTVLVRLLSYQVT